MDTEDDDTMSQEEWHKEMQTEIAAYPCKARDLDEKLDGLVYQINCIYIAGALSIKNFERCGKT